MVLLRFIYDVIERGRRRALGEMLLAATVEPGDAAIRSRILRYLESTQYSEALEAVIAAPDGGLMGAMDTAQTVRSPSDAAELRGQVSRYLESYPDHPALLMVRAVSEAACARPDRRTVRQNFLAACGRAGESYRLETPARCMFIARAAARIACNNPSLANELQGAALRAYPERLLARAFVARLPDQLAVRSARFLLCGLAERIKQLTHHKEAFHVPRTGDVPAG